MTTMEVPQGSFTLRRHPERPDPPTRRAGDAADEFLLHHLHDVQTAGEPVVVVNDAFGALGVALAGRVTASWGDSHLARLALRANLMANGREPDAVAFVPSTQSPAGPIALALLKVPRDASLLEHQLRGLRPLLAPGARVLAAAMARHIHTSTLEVFARVLGPTATSRARKKARLVHAEIDPGLDPGPTPYPARFAVGDLPVVGHAGVFAHDRLDIGTRALLEHLPELSERLARSGAHAADGVPYAVDLGCGSGILGTALARRAAVRIGFRDVSYLAVWSAGATAAANGIAPGHFDAVAADVLAGTRAGSVDAIVSNPPFHDSHAIGDAIAWQMFVESRRALRPGGELWVVGNRHLGYHAKLRRLFGAAAVTVVAGSPKFVVLRATKVARG